MHSKDEMSSSTPDKDIGDHDIPQNPESLQQATVTNQEQVHSQTESKSTMNMNTP